MRNKNKISGLSRLASHAKAGKNQSGFTLIELLVVIAIIALLSSIALIAMISARSKSRDAKRLSDMAQMNTGLELYFSTNKGYPSSTAGIPLGMAPFSGTVPPDPQPADGACSAVVYPGGSTGSSYYYTPSGTFYLGSDGITQVYPGYNYYFCLGAQTGAFAAGMHILTPA